MIFEIMHYYYYYYAKGKDRELHHFAWPVLKPDPNLHQYVLLSMVLEESLPSIRVDEKDDLTDIMSISNEFNYLTPSKCFYILMGEFTEEKRLLGRLEYCILSCSETFVSVFPQLVVNF
jgi:hypothetical protein